MLYFYISSGDFIMDNTEQTLEYRAMFDIDHGVSPGFGIKYPDHSRESLTFTANNDIEALAKIFQTAARFSNDYLSNPNTALTKVIIEYVIGPDGNTIEQQLVFDPRWKELQNSSYKVKCQRAYYLEKRKCIVVESSTMFHLLTL